MHAARFCVAASIGALVALAGCVSGPQAADRYAALVASPDRAPGDRVNDERRKPVDTLAFIGAKPGMVALDVSAARGYTSELVARAVAPGGKVYAQRPPAARTSTPPAQPEGASAPRPAGAVPPMPALADRVKTPAGANIIPVFQPWEEPAPPEVANNALDLVTLMFNYHDFGHIGVDRAKTNAAIFRALKPGGLYIIADHSGRPGTGISEAGTLHRVEEAFVVREVEAAGFKLVEVGNFLRNPADPRDKNTPEPPMPKDEFVLKFRKP